MKMAPFVHYEEVCCLTIGMTHKSRLWYGGFFLCRCVVAVISICDHNLHG